MPHNENDHLQAVKNQLLERRRAIEARYRDELKRLQNEMRKLEEYAKMIGDLQGDLPTLLSGDIPTVAEASAREGRVDLSGHIDKYFVEHEEGGTAASIKAYIIAMGVDPYPSLYNSIHEALRRRVERGELEKVDGKFKPKASHAD